MINLSINKQLEIIVPNTNKALAVVLKEATPKEMEAILKNKDLGSVVSSLLRESAQNSDANSALLGLVKSNPTLKSLGDVSGTIKELLQVLEGEKTPLPVQGVLKKFLLDIKEVSEPALKQKFENSGVFLESRLKNVQNPQVELKNLLQELEKGIAKSDMPAAKLALQTTKELLATPILKEATSASIAEMSKADKPALAHLAKVVEEVVSKLGEGAKGADIMYTKTFEKQLAKLEFLITPKMLSAENFKADTLVDALQTFSAQIEQSPQLMQSTKPELKGLLETLTKLFESIKSGEVAQNPKSVEEMRGVVDVLKVALEKADPIFSKETAAISSKLAHFTNPQKLETQEGVKEILAQDLKAVLLQANDEIAKSSHPNQQEILKQIDKALLQIDYFQLVSHLSNASSLYLPFSWDSLQEGNITINRDKNSAFYCDIDLTLKEHGALKLKLTLYDENQINIHIYSDSIALKERVKENIASLRAALIEGQITPREIRIFDATKKNPLLAYGSEQRDIDMGFEVKV